MMTSSQRGHALHPPAPRRTLADELEAGVPLDDERSGHRRLEAELSRLRGDEPGVIDFLRRAPQVDRQAACLKLVGLVGAGRANLLARRAFGKSPLAETEPAQGRAEAT